ncbi:MAG: hypothetical protein HY318_11310, partial [Armatimonadetes bacterium]|nr:hypothetical protein [Armatimonadota bacterium]
MKRAGRKSAIPNPPALVLSVLLVSIATGLPAPAAGLGRLVLVKDGRPVSSLVLGDNASPVESHAARELQQYIQKISGAWVPIRKCRDRPVGSRILLGTPTSNSEIKTLKEQMRQLPTLGREGFILRRIGTDLVIAGQRSHGVLYGTYTFLEKYLGCRWFFPGEAGEVVPKHPTIALANVLEVGKPSLAYRGLGVFQTSGHQYDQDIIDWMARNKFNAKPTHHHVIGLNRGIGFEDPPASTETQYEAMTTRAIVPDTNVHSFWWLLPAKDYFDAHP